MKGIIHLHTVTDGGVGDQGGPTGEGGGVNDKQFNVYFRSLAWDGDNNRLNKEYSQLSIAGNDNLIQRKPTIAVQYKVGATNIGNQNQNQFVITWQEQYYEGISSFFKVMGKGLKINKSGRIAVADINPLQISPTYTENQVTKKVVAGQNGSFLPRVAIATDGKVMISWTDDRSKATQGKDIYGRIYDIDEFFAPAGVPGP